MVANPAWASSTALSMISNAMWCRPEPSSVSPIYMPGSLAHRVQPAQDGDGVGIVVATSLLGRGFGGGAAGSDMPSEDSG